MPSPLTLNEANFSLVEGGDHGTFEGVFILEALPHIFDFSLLVVFRTICQPRDDLVGLDSPRCLVIQFLPSTRRSHLIIS